MEIKFYSVANSCPTTSVMEWDGSKWCDKWEDCEVISRKPYIFRAPDGGCYTTIFVGYLQSSQGYIWNDFPRTFLEGQPCILVDAQYLHD